MTDQPDDARLTPEQEADVRRLLADARHTEAAPAAVVARLDATLADLAGEPVREEAVVNLADRRRKAATMLVAAAAVLVIGVGLSQVLPRGDAGESVTSADAEAGAGADDQPGLEPTPDLTTSEGAEDLDAQKLTPLRLSARRFARDAAALQGFRVSGYAADDREAGGASKQATRDRNGTLAPAARQEVCDPGVWGRGRYVPVVYERGPGWVVLRRPQGESQIVDLFLCGSETAARSVTLPFP